MVPLIRNQEPAFRLQAYKDMMVYLDEQRALNRHKLDLNNIDGNIDSNEANFDIIHVQGIPSSRKKAKKLIKPFIEAEIGSWWLDGWSYAPWSPLTEQEMRDKILAGPPDI